MHRGQLPGRWTSKRVDSGPGVPKTPFGPGYTWTLKSDLRNHQAIVQPRLYDRLMVTQITLKTEGPHGSDPDWLVGLAPALVPVMGVAPRAGCVAPAGTRDEWRFDGE